MWLNLSNHEIFRRSINNHICILSVVDNDKKFTKWVFSVVDPITLILEIQLEYTYNNLTREIKQTNCLGLIIDFAKRTDDDYSLDKYLKLVDMSEQKMEEYIKAGMKLV